MTTLGFSGGTITLRTFSDNADSVSVEVTDTGEGIPTENLKKVFDPFFTTKGIGNGTGLGLAVTYGIIQEHGGQIEVESELRKGTSFHILLPLVRFAQGVVAA